MKMPPNNDAPPPIGFEVPARLLSEEGPEEALPNIEGYAVARLMGRGGRSSVYRVFRRDSHRPLALKLMIDPPAAGQIERARSIVPSLSRLQLAHTATMIEHGEHNACLYFVGQFIDGLPLDEFGLSPWGRRPLPERVELLAKIAEALAEVHGHGLAHGALTTGNVLVTIEGAPVIIDLGVESVLRDTPPSAAQDIRALAELAALVLSESSTAPSPARAPAIPEPVRAAVGRLETATHASAASEAAAFAAALRRWLSSAPAGRGLWQRLRRLLGRA